MESRVAGRFAIVNSIHLITFNSVVRMLVDNIPMEQLPGKTVVHIRIIPEQPMLIHELSRLHF